MITIWHNQNFLSLWISRLFNKSFPDSIPLEDLIPVAMVESDNLDLAWALSQQELIDSVHIKLINPSRSTSIGDILQKSDNSCWWVDCTGFASLAHPLPHVGIVKDCSPADDIEIFPTLDLPNWTSAEIISTTRLADTFYYLETRQWHNQEVRQLLRSYK